MTRRLIDNGTTNNLMYAFCEASSSFHGVGPVTATNVQRDPIQHSIVCRDDDRGARHGDTGTASIPASYSHGGKPFVAWLDGAKARAMAMTFGFAHRLGQTLLAANSVPFMKYPG